MSTDVKNPHPFFGFFLVIVGTALFSCKSIFIKLAYQYTPTAEIIITLRMLFALPFYVLIAWWLHKRSAQYLYGSVCLKVFALGIIGYYGASLLDFIGLLYIGASLERLILFTYPCLTILLGALLLRQRLTIRLSLCIVVIYAGLGLVFIEDLISNTSHNVMLGSALVFGSALLFALYCLGADHMMRVRKHGSRLFTAYAMSAACVMMIMHYSLFYPLHDLLNQPLTVYWLAFAIAIISTVIPSFMLSAGIQFIGASHATMTGSLGPVITLILAAWFLNEPVTIIQICGFLVVIGTVTLLGYWKHKAK